MKTLLSEFNTPNIIQDFLKMFSKGCNIRINVNYTDALNGYGVRERIDVVIYVLVNECVREECGYHSLYNDESTCKRCLIKSEYQPIFGWNSESKLSLEQSFIEFLKLKSSEFNYELKNKIGLMLNKWEDKNDKINILEVK